MKKLLTIVLALAMVLGLAACGGQTSTTTSSTTAATTEKTETAAAAETKAETITLVMAEVNPLDGTVCGAMDLAFKEKVEELSGGQIQIDLQGSGVLGVEADILDGMFGGTGTVDICRISAFALTSYGTKKSVLLSLPYTFNDREHFWAFADSELAQDFLNESVEVGLGVKGLYYGEEGFRHFFSAEDKPIATPDDCKGLKIRVSNDPIMTAMVENLGGTPCSVSMAEIYQSLDNGTIDAAEQPTVNYLANSFQQVGPNLVLDGHTLGAMMTIISEEVWNGLTEEQQGWITEAGKYASQQCRELSESKEQEALDTLKAEGRNIIEVSDKSAWQAACSPITEEYVTGDLVDIYNQILELGK